LKYEGESFAYQFNEQDLIDDEKQRIQVTLFNEKKKIITNCLSGGGLNPNAMNICRLRLWIELLKNAYYKELKDKDGTLIYELETLPNIGMRQGTCFFLNGSSFSKI
jgi:hypothetical protein